MTMRDILDVRTKHVQRNGLRLNLLAVSCEMCGAKPGDRCVSETGKETSAHSARHHVVMQARKEYNCKTTNSK